MLWIPEFRPKKDKNWLDWLLLPVTLVVSFLIILTMAFVLGLIWPVTIPTALILRWSAARRVRRARQQWLDSGRAMAWEEVEQRLKQGEGSLISGEVAGMSSMSSDGVWWTPETPEKMEPSPLFISDNEVIKQVCALLGTVPGDFFPHYVVHSSSVEIFADRYLNPQHGSSMLTQGPELIQRFDALWEHCRKRLGDVRVIIVSPPQSRAAEYDQELESLFRWVWISAAACCATGIAGFADLAREDLPMQLFLIAPHLMGVGLVFWARRRHPFAAMIAVGASGAMALATWVIELRDAEGGERVFDNALSGVFVSTVNYAILTAAAIAALIVAFVYKRTPPVTKEIDCQPATAD